LIAIVLWFDNAQGGLTGNGVFKSLELRPWVTDPANAPLYPSNYLFYTFYGALCRLLDLLGVFQRPAAADDHPNAVSCSLCLGVVYLLIRSVTGDAWWRCWPPFHLASSCDVPRHHQRGHHAELHCAVAAMALGSVWLAQPTAARVVAVSVLFSIAWLMEWRLMFPTLPACWALCPCEPSRPAAGWIAFSGPPCGDGGHHCLPGGVTTRLSAVRPI
jgi:hypothetical protein